MEKTPSLFRSFFQSEKSGGIILVCCAAVSLLITNFAGNGHYAEFWKTDIAGHSITDWINDGLMTLFFLLIGLELEREIYSGQLSSFSKAALPAFSALGGVLIPALLFFIVNHNQESVTGVGIPMATDIAFAIGILSLLGDKVPFSLKIFLTALAVIDDLLAILVIAFFYTEQIHFIFLLLALLCFTILLILNRMKIERSIYYIIGGFLMWYFMFHSGIHPTISGVLLAFALPFGSGSKPNISYKWQENLHYPVAFLILPLFALANTCITFEHRWISDLNTPLSWGIFIGLILGKPIGIFSFCFLIVKSGICKLPVQLEWKQILGVGLLGGIGFTMSIFITLLAFNHAHLIDISKIAIIFASLISGILGSIYLYFVLPSKNDASIKKPQLHHSHKTDDAD